MYDLPSKTINDIYSKDYIALDKDVKVNTAVNMMLKNNLPEVIIIDENEYVIGILTHNDIANAMKERYKLSTITLAKFVNKSIRTVSENAVLSECRDAMYKLKYGQLPVTRNGKLVGVIRSTHIRDHYYMEVEEFNYKIRNIIEAIHEAVCVIDQYGVIVYWNKSAEKLYKIKADDIIGKSVLKYFPSAILTKVLTEKEAVENVLHSPREDTYIAISASPVYYKGELFAIVSTDRDITDVMNLSNDLEKATSTVKLLEEQVDKISSDTFGGLIGNDPDFLKCVDVGRLVAKSNVSVYISGESGTGKEVFARAIHKKSNLEGLFVPVNCSAIPNELFESEFFGYESGAFTGASQNGKIGYFELADNGTLFLDEVADLPLNLQAKLLRVIESGEFNKVGSSELKKVNVRIISATNKDLSKLMKNGEFREDLYYRLNVVNINLPSLRDRKQDIELFIDKFIAEISQKNQIDQPEITNSAINMLKNYCWNGNIRELKNTVEQMLVLCQDNKLDISDIPSHIQRSYAKNDNEIIDDFDINKAVENLEKNMIKSALLKTEGNKTETAKLLGIKRTTLYYKLNYYGFTNQDA